MGCPPTPTPGGGRPAPLPPGSETVNLCLQYWWVGIGTRPPRQCSKQKTLASQPSHMARLRACLARVGRGPKRRPGPALIAGQRASHRWNRTLRTPAMASLDVPTLGGGVRGAHPLGPNTPPTCQTPHEVVRPTRTSARRSCRTHSAPKATLPNLQGGVSRGGQVNA